MDLLALVRPIKKWRTYEAPSWFEDQETNAVVVYHGVCRKCKALAEADGIATYYGTQVGTLHDAPAPVLSNNWYGRMEPWFQRVVEGRVRTYARRVKWQSDHERLWRIDTVIKMDYETWLWTHDHRARAASEPGGRDNNVVLPDTGGTGSP